jgi:CubicO group peptidase (beta-lactamase class C family)
MKPLISYLFYVVIAVNLYSCKKNDEGPSSEPQKDIAGIDNLVTAWMTTNNMPGASIAISKNGKLVYRKGYGKANTGSNEAVTVESRFRIASVSKPITGVAVLKLVQDGRLTLNQKIFGAGGALGTTYGTQPYKPGITDITVEHLLKHLSGGWGSAAQGDPAFYDSSMTHTALINWTLDNTVLGTTPGSTYRYSNFNYILLSKVIERVSGKTYENYVKEDILNPIGATNSLLAGNNLSLKRTNEVTYYGQGGDVPFVYALYNYTRSEGAFGWVSTPTDVLRFANAVDSSATRPDILNGSTLASMATGSAANAYYGCGWGIEGPEWYWFGSLPGTASFIYRNKNGINIAFAANSRLQPSPNNALNALLPLINYIASDNTIPWQDIDQF